MPPPSPSIPRRLLCRQHHLATLHDRVLRAANGLREKASLQARRRIATAEHPRVPDRAPRHRTPWRGDVHRAHALPRPEIETILRTAARSSFSPPPTHREAGAASHCLGYRPMRATRSFCLHLGTTASPKPCRTPIARCSQQRLAPRSMAHRALAVLCPRPFSHLYGLYSLHCAWSVRACTILLPAFKPDELPCRRAVETYRNCGPRRRMSRVPQRRLFDKHDWSSLPACDRLWPMARPPRPASAGRARLAVTQLWGMTELRRRSTRGRATPPKPRRRVQAGRARQQVRTSDEGELPVRGPLTFSAITTIRSERRRLHARWLVPSGDLAARARITPSPPHQDIINRRRQVQSGRRRGAARLASQILQSRSADARPGAREKACAFITFKPAAMPHLQSHQLSARHAIARTSCPSAVVIPNAAHADAQDHQGRLRLPEKP